MKLQDLKGCLVQYHTGGIMFAGEVEEYPEGWYLFLDGEGIVEVNVDLSSVPYDVLTA